MEPGTAVKTEEVLKLSDRVNRISESPTMVVLQAAAALKAKGVDVADFGAGEPDFPTPEHIKRAAIQALDKIIRSTRRSRVSRRCVRRFANGTRRSSARRTSRLNASST